MDYNPPKPIINIRHSRLKVSFRLLLSQIIGAGWLWCIYAFFNDLVKPSQYFISVFAIFGGGVSYALLTWIVMSKMINPDYLTVFDDGLIIYTPFYKPTRLHLSSQVQWAVQDRKIHFRDGSRAPVHSYLLPPTLKKSTVPNP